MAPLLIWVTPLLIWVAPLLIWCKVRIKLTSALASTEVGVEARTELCKSCLLKSPIKFYCLGKPYPDFFTKNIVAVNTFCTHILLTKICLQTKISVVQIFFTKILREAFIRKKRKKFGFLPNWGYTL